jgi:hypothetical protein
MFIVENELGEGRLESLNSKEVQVIGLYGGAGNWSVMLIMK